MLRPYLLQEFDFSTGGYHHPNAARLWTSLTALVIGKTLDEDIPDHCNWPRYGPSYKLSVEPALTKDTNKRGYLDDCISIINGGYKIQVPNNKCENYTMEKNNVENMSYIMKWTRAFEDLLEKCLCVGPTYNLNGLFLI